MKKFFPRKRYLPLFFLRSAKNAAKKTVPVMTSGPTGNSGTGCPGISNANAVAKKADNNRDDTINSDVRSFKL